MLDKIIKLLKIAILGVILVWLLRIFGMQEIVEEIFNIIKGGFVK